jgi:hypothetical protein
VESKNGAVIRKRMGFDNIALSVPAAPMFSVRSTCTDMMMASAKKMVGSRFAGLPLSTLFPYRGRTTAVTTIPEAVKAKNLTIADKAQVRRMVAGDDGKVSGVKAFPNGLANKHGEVGRHYFGHWDAQAGAGVSALFPFDLNAWYGYRAKCDRGRMGRR